VSAVLLRTSTAFLIRFAATTKRRSLLHLLARVPPLQTLVHGSLTVTRASTRPTTRSLPLFRSAPRALPSNGVGEAEGVAAAEQHADTGFQSLRCWQAPLARPPQLQRRRSNGLALLPQACASASSSSTASISPLSCAVGHSHSKALRPNFEAFSVMPCGRGWSRPSQVLGRTTQPVAGNSFSRHPACYCTASPANRASNLPSSSGVQMRSAAVIGPRFSAQPAPHLPRSLPRAHPLAGPTLSVERRAPPRSSTWGNFLQRVGPSRPSHSPPATNPRSQNSGTPAADLKHQSCHSHARHAAAGQPARGPAGLGRRPFRHDQ